MTHPGRRETRATVGALLAVGLLALLVACSSGPRAAPGPAAPPAATPAPSPSPAAANCGNPTASLRPPAALPAPGAMPAGTYMRTIQDRGRLVAGVSQDTLLFGAVNPFNGQIEGFDIDVVREVARAIFGDPSKIEFRAINTAERIPKIRDGSVDMVGRTFTITCDRRQQVDEGLYKREGFEP